jgi:hypothetical protein
MTEPLAAPPAPSRRKLLIGSAAAVSVAAVALVVFILPAEYGIDPTGAGSALGLTKLAEPGPSEEEIRGARRKGALVLAAQPPQETDWDDRFTYELLPYEGIELKYTLTEGQPIEFAWRASVPVEVDMHAHPFEGGEELTETYSKKKSAGEQGRYIPQFTGLHGWYWENRTLEPVTLTAEASGPIEESTLFEGGIPHPRELTPHE